MSAIDHAYNIDDLARLAKKRLPKGLYDFLDRGAEDETTVRENARSIKDIGIRQRVGIDVSKRDISTSLFDVPQSMPVGLGVTGTAGIFAHKGEQALAQAAADAGISYTLGSSNFASMAELKEILGDLLWRQLYPPRTPELLEHHLSKAREVGVRVLVLTLDSPVHGNREYLMRNGLLPHQITKKGMLSVLRAPYWLFGTLLPYMLRDGMPRLEDMPEGHKTMFGKGNTGLSLPADYYSWDIVRDIRKRWPGKLVIKGISTGEDAVIAGQCGADGVIVSNHGGRSLDGCVPSMGALAEVVDAVGSTMTVMVDGGFKRGVDVLKAIAMGADAVMLGRATFYGLAAGGRPGVARALTIIRQEIDRSLALMGATRLDQLDRTFLRY